MPEIETTPLAAAAQRFPVYYESADDQHCRETRALLHLIAQTEGAILEIGTHTGIKAMEIALNFPNRAVATMDWSYAHTTMRSEQAEQLPPHEIGMRCRHLPNILQLDMDSKALEYAELAAAVGPIGFIFIDGDHSDDGVKADTEKAIAYAKACGAVIAWHDFGGDSPEWVGVQRVLTDLASEGLCITEIEGTRTAFCQQFQKQMTTTPDTDDTLPRYVDISLLPEHQQPRNLPEHWRKEKIEAAIWTRGLPPQLTINGEPLAHAYVPPDCSEWKFKPCAGGNSIWEHLGRLADLASCAAVIVEIGIATMNGSTHAFDLGLQKSDRPDCQKYHIGVDIHPSISGPWVPQSPWWEFVSGSSKDPATVQKVLHAITSYMDGDGMYTPPIDILYIDTVHEYDFLKAELANWLPVIGPNTLVLFHDTHRGGQYHEMTNAILEMVAENGPLVGTHEYLQLSETCEGLGALSPLNGWPL